MDSILSYVEQFFAYIIGLGAAVMMPILFTILGCSIGIKFSTPNSIAVRRNCPLMYSLSVTALQADRLWPFSLPTKGLSGNLT